MSQVMNELDAIAPEGSETEAVRAATAPKFQQTLTLSSWCYSNGKRVFDFCVAFALLLLGLPFLAIGALMIKLTSRGPVIFKQKRVGQNDRDFILYKLRTMSHENHDSRLGLTRTGDPRVTPVGRVVRLMKIDELPQLYNVLRGDMSMIGWRPHLRRLLGNSPEQKQMLSLRPGVTGAATIRFRHEEKLLPPLTGKPLEKYYIQSILPEKIAIELEYARTASLWSDINTLFQTFGAVAMHNHVRNTSHRPIPTGGLRKAV